MGLVSKTTPTQLSLVYHTGGLGDFITALPAIREWNRHNRGLRQILLGKPATGILGVHEGLFDEVWDVESASSSRLYVPDGPLSQPLAERLSRVKAALVFASPGSPLVSHMRRFVCARLSAHDPRPGQRIHVCAYHLALVNKRLKMSARHFPRLTPCPAFAHEADELLGKRKACAVLHPGSGSARKNWPAQRFITLAQELEGKGLSIAWIAGPAEEGRYQVPPSHTVIRNAPLPVLVHVFARANLYIGNDSGISHLAAASGAPSVVLFGSSDPAVWRPLGKMVTIIVAHRRPCFPCHPSVAGKGTSEGVECAGPCINTISVPEVFDACMKIARKN
jgi:ADP-heptose:LPS heptosyltransferase